MALNHGECTIIPLRLEINDRVFTGMYGTDESFRHLIGCSDLPNMNAVSGNRPTVSKGSEEEILQLLRQKEHKQKARWYVGESEELS